MSDSIQGHPIRELRGIADPNSATVTEKGLNTFMVTSVPEGEGKTLTAINLALTSEGTTDGSTHDGDLKNQQIHKYLGYEKHEGDR